MSKPNDQIEALEAAAGQEAACATVSIQSKRQPTNQ